MTRERALRFVHEFRERLLDVYGDRLKEVCLYGSHARDEASDD